MNGAGVPVEVALVGAGRRGWCHLEILAALPEPLRLVGVCDADPGTLARAARLAGPEAVLARSVRDLLARCRPRFAVVSLMQDAQVRMIRTLLEAGVSVLTEVPPGYDGPGMQSLVDLAARRELVLAAAENYVRTPLERFKQGLIAAGVFGRVTRAEVAGSIGHKGHEIAVARSYLERDAKPVRARAEARGEPGQSTGERILVRPELFGSVEFDTGSEAAFELRLIRDLASAELRSDFEGPGGGCRRNELYLRRDGAEQPAPIEWTIRQIGAEPVPQQLRIAAAPQAPWRNPFADHAFPAASRRPYLCRIDDTPQSWEIALADAFLDTAAAIRERRPPEYDVARARVDVRIRLMLLESARRGGEWVDWQEEPWPIERELRSRAWLRRALLHPWTRHAVRLRDRLRGTTA